MLARAIENIDQHIALNITKISGLDLYQFKKEFYDICLKYMGHSRNLTGITELLVSIYLKHYLKERSLSFRLEPNAKRKGENGRKNEVDIAFVSSQNIFQPLKQAKIEIGFSVKHQISGISWYKHEEQSELGQLIKQKYGNNNLAQDLFRLENIKRGSNDRFGSCTFIFEEVTPNYKQILQSISKDFPDHIYVVLQDNTIPIWKLLSPLEDNL